MQQEMTQVRLDEMRGSPVYDEAGEKIGKVEEIFYDYETSVPEWIGLGTGFFGKKRVLVPVQGAQTMEDGLMVPYSKDKVNESPDIDSDEISERCEADLVAHYGLGYSTERSDTGLTEGRGRSTEGKETVTRAEEELEVGTRPVEAGSARLRKWVETEPVVLDVELKREVARVTSEQIDQPVDDHEFEEEEVEIPLHAEKPVVQKQAVAKERVGLETDVQTETETVSDELKKERVEVEGDVEKRKRKQ
jgi:stress response protein YsnF